MPERNRLYYLHVIGTEVVRLNARQILPNETATRSLAYIGFVH